MMDDTRERVPVVDLTDPDDLSQLRTRIEELETELQVSRTAIGQLQLQLDLFTSTDPMTGFVNRTGTLDAVQVAIDRLDRMGELFSIMTVRFPHVDALITDDPAALPAATRHAGALLGGGLRRLDRVGRLEDNTFVMVLANVTADGVDVVRDRLMRVLEVGGENDTLREPQLATLLVVTPAVHEPDPLLEAALAMLDEGGANELTKV